MTIFGIIMGSFGGLTSKFWIGAMVLKLKIPNIGLFWALITGIFGSDQILYDIDHT